MFYTAKKEAVEQKYPDIVNINPNAIRGFYTDTEGNKRFFDRVHGYYFSDKEWGTEEEWMVEGLDQEWVDDYLSLNIRNGIKAPDGWTFASCDYAAQELRLGAINTKGKAFLTAFMNNEDVHLTVAKMMYGEDNVKADKKKYRSKAKTCNFALAYGGNAYTLTRSGLTMEEAEEQYEAYMMAQADHFGVQNQQVKNTKRTMCDHTFFGLPVRLHTYYKTNSWKDISAGERLAKNHRIQGTGADVLSIAFIKLWKNIFKEVPNIEDYLRFQITVHDEVCYIIKNEAIDILIPKIIENMQTQMPDWEIPLTIGLSFGPTFGAQYEWKYDPTTFKVLEPQLEPVKKETPKVVEIKEEVPKEPEIVLEF